MPEDPASAEPALPAATTGERIGGSSGEQPRSPFSWRAVAIGAAGAMAVGVGAPYCVFMLKGSSMAINSTVPIALFYFFIVVVIANVILGLVARRWELRKADLILIYVMLTMAAAVPNQAFVGYVIPCIAGFFYLRHPGKQMVGHVPGGRPEVDGPRRRGRGAVARGPSPGDAGSLAGMGRAVDLVVPLLPRPESDDGLPQRDTPPPVVGSRAARVPDGAGAAAHDRALAGSVRAAGTLLQEPLGLDRLSRALPAARPARAESLPPGGSRLQSGLRRAVADGRGLHPQVPHQLRLDRDFPTSSISTSP